MSLLLALTMESPQADSALSAPVDKLVLPELMQSGGAGKPVEACLLGGKLIMLYNCILTPQIYKRSAAWCLFAML